MSIQRIIQSDVKETALSLVHEDRTAVMSVADLTLKLKLAKEVVGFLNPFFLSLRQVFVLVECLQCV